MILNIKTEDKDKHGIYCIRNLVDESRYIGQTTEGFYNRWLRHSNMLKNQNHFNKHLQNAYNKYGPDSFEMFVVEVCDDPNIISLREEYYISKCKEEYRCYNFLSGGPTMFGSNNPFWGKKHSPQTIEKISKSRVGKYTGKNNNFFGVDHSGENNGFYGKHHTLEARKKMSESKSKLYIKENNPFYGKHHTLEALAKMQNNGKHAQRKVVCIETGVVYESIKEAAKQTNTSAKSISAVCCGSRKTANNLHWEHVSKRGQ